MDTPSLLQPLTLDINTLHNDLTKSYDGTNKTFLFSNANLNDPNLEILISYFPANQLQLSQVQQFNLTDTGATIMGNCQLQINSNLVQTPAAKFVNTQLTITYTLTNSNLEVQTSFSIPDPNWTLNLLFADLAKTIFAQLPFTPTTNSPTLLTLNTNKISQGELAFDFSANVAHLSQYKFLSYLSAIPSSATIQGSILLNQKLPQVYLTMDLGDDKLANFFEASNSLILSTIITPFNSTFIFQELNLLQITLKVTVDGAQQTIACQTRVDPNFNALLNLEADLNFKIQSLASLSSLFPSTSFTNLLPSGFLPPQFGLKKIGLVLSPFFKTITALSVDISIDLSWSMLNNALDVTFDTLSISVANPFSSEKMLSGSLQATLNIGSANFAVVASCAPNFILQADLTSGTIKLSELVKKLIPSATSIPCYEINALSLILSLNKSDSNWGINVGFANKSISLGNTSLTFEQFQGYLNYTSSQNPWSGGFSGAVSCGGCTFFLTTSCEQDLGFNFSGFTGQMSPINVGDFFSQLAKDLGLSIPTPACLNQLKLQYASINISTQTKQYDLTCYLQMPVGDQILNLTLTVHITNGTCTFTGQINIAALTFNVIFDHDTQNSILLASYSYTPSPTSTDCISISKLCQLISPSLASQIPSSLNIRIQDAFFIYENSSDKSFVIMGIDLSQSFDLLNHIEILGKNFPKDEASIQNLRFLITTDLIAKDQITAINSILKSIAPLVSQSSDGSLPKGIILSANATLASQSQPLVLNLLSSSSTPTIKQASDFVTTDSPSINPPGQWISVQRSFGPLNLEKLGLQFDNGNINFLLQASITLTGLQLDLEGLGFGLSLTNPSDVEFVLDGIAVSYTNPSVTVSGGLVKSVDSQGNTSYSGSLLVQTESFNVMAMGSYCTINGQPSMTLFLLESGVPLGGPPAFFVTGLAAGFGFNRNLIIPSIDQVPTFPLIEGATGHNSPFQDNDPQKALSVLSQWVPVEMGENWIAAGLSFTSFDLLNSVAIITASFGAQFEVAILGLSTLSLPPNDPNPIVFAQLELLAQFKPAEGVFSILANLTSSSYVFTSDCHLTGGFAFCLWFSPSQYAGDFVVTFGGYNPHFTPNSNYPPIARLGLNWQLCDPLCIKGGAYFALTPTCVMAGGALEATWQSGPLSAWFDFSADFLIAWKPFHYDVEMSVSIGVAVTIHFIFTIHISASISADLHLWGPDFTGTAHIHLWVASFTISFGAASQQTTPPLSWVDFKQSFLPATDKICTITVQRGLVQTTTKSSTPLQLINPEQLILTTYCAIPSKTFNVIGSKQPAIPPTWTTDFGIGLVQTPSNDFSSEHQIKVYRDGEIYTPFTDKFVLIPICGNAPKALWLATSNPSFDNHPMITNVLTGFQIVPIAFVPDILVSIPIANLQYNQVPILPLTWSKPTIVTSDSFDQTHAMEQLEQSIDASASSYRQSLLDSIKTNGVILSETINLQAFATDASNWLLSAPKLQYLGEEKTQSGF